MSRRLAGAVAVLAVAGLMAAAAQALTTQGDYNGAVTGDPFPGSHINFDIKRTASGTRRVVDFVASKLDYECDGGSPGETTAVSMNRVFRIRRDRTFGGHADAVILGFDPPARLTGKLRRHHRVRGTLRIRGELDPEGQPGVDCDTGRLEWRARKGPLPLVP
jgi:hypothetical protein